MSTAPPGWYDDPERADSLRYWDGSQWTPTRAPKTPVVEDRDAWSLVVDTAVFSGRNWRPLVLFAVPILFTQLGAYAAALAGLDRALSPDPRVILDRVSEAGFDPFDKANDRAFIESIRFDFSSAVLAWWVLAAIAVVVAAVVSLGVHRWAIAVSSGADMGPARAVADVVGRLPRLALWSLAYGAVVAAGVLGLVAMAWVAPVSLLLSVPAVIAGVIWLVPISAMVTSVLVVGPRRVRVLETSMGLVTGRWWAFAGRMLLLWLAVVIGGLVLGFGAGAVGSLGYWPSLIAQTSVSVAQSVVGQVGGAMLYLWAGGPISSRLKAAEADAT